MLRGFIALGCLAFGQTAFAADLGKFEPPVQIQAAGAPIDVLREGHSAPFFGDFDGDGLPDLLVGEFHEGRLRIYLNRGTAAKPQFADYMWFKAGADLGRVPVG